MFFSIKLRDDSNLQKCENNAIEIFQRMFNYPPTLVIRHRRENLKKCSLAGLELQKDFLFVKYPLENILKLDNYCMLTMDENVPLLSTNDAHKGLLVLDATWRLALKMEAHIPEIAYLEKRSLPSGFITAYPRRQHDCPDPSRGLSSIEAIAIAYQILGRNLDHLLENYYWKETFFSQNESLWKNLKPQS